jgi:hypothetical protein
MESIEPHQGKLTPFDDKQHMTLYGEICKIVDVA